MADVLIAGCGYVGSALAGLLVAQGHRVWGLRRSDSPLPGGVTPLRADLSQPRSLAGLLPETLNAVVYCAAAKSFDDQTYQAVYVEGLRNLLGQLAELPSSPSRVIFTSSTGVYGQTGGEWVDESSETIPAGFSGQRVLEGERLLHAAPFSSVALRLGGIYGPGRTGALDRAREKGLRGVASSGEPNPQYTNRIHRDDCAGALAHLLFTPGPAPLYIGVDHEPTTDTQVLEWLRTRLPKSPPSAPDGPPSPIRRSSNKRCRNQRLIDSGYSFTFPTFREGFGSLWPESQGSGKPA